MKKSYIFLIIGISIITITCILTMIFIKNDFKLVGNKKEIYYTINDDKPNLLDGVYGIVNKAKVTVSVDESSIDWHQVGNYTAKYIYNGKVVGKIKIIVKLRNPYITNYIDLIYYLDGNEELNYFATDIRAYDIYNVDITYNKSSQRRILVDDSKVNKNKLGVYKATYKIVDGYGNEGEATINVTVRKKDQNPEIYGYDNPLYFIVGNTYDSKDLIKDIEAYSYMGVNISEKIIVDSSRIDLSIEGIYYLEYIVSDNGYSTKGGREVIVISKETPLITGVKDYLILDVGDIEINLLKGIRALDYVDKELTDHMEIFFRHKNDETLLDIFDFFENYINEVGDYYIVYKVTNSLGITSYKEMYLKIILDVYPPIIEGIKDIIHRASYDIPDYLNGVIAYKEYDDITVDLTDKIVVKLLDKSDNKIYDVNDVNYNVLKNYVILYQVTDDKGYIIEVQRNLYIIDEDEPVFYNIPFNFTYVIGDGENELPNYKTGVVAWDFVDGDLSSIIDIDESNVNYLVPGQYYVEYIVSDYQGNTAIHRVIVDVKQ